jgi:hypothetical protein
MVGQSIVQVLGPEDGWILERLARQLAAKLPYAVFSHANSQLFPDSALAYYVNYFLYNSPSSVLDVGFFTHFDEAGQFLERARRMDFCVSMSRKYEMWLLRQGVKSVTCIPMGFDSYGYRPRLVIGVIGLLDHPRKGKHLVQALRKLPFVEVIATEGRVTEEQLPDFYQRLDYVLIPATVEGGPMSLLEGLGMGKPIIAPDDVGMIPEFENSEHIRCYPTGDVEALVKVVRECYEEKAARRRLVQDRSWDRWAEAHHHLFQQLLQSRGIELPKPQPGFRFGMMGELDIPLGIDARPLEAAIDLTARHLYFGRYPEARAVLEEILPQYPFTEKLLDTFPNEKNEFSIVSRSENKDLEKKSLQVACVLAIQNRPGEYLERTLRTYAYQTFRPVDKVLLDYGSGAGFSAAYKQICGRYGWRYVAGTPTKPGWSLSAAYNLAISQLASRVDVVFKSDIDVLLGETVLADAAQFGRDKLCIFSCLGTIEGTVLPQEFKEPRDLAALLQSSTPPVSMLGEGIHAFPKSWFEEIGGYDLEFEGWGFEDSDLRVRAQKSIGVHTDTTALLIHQWHPRTGNDEQAAKNRAHYNCMKSASVIRNGGKLGIGTAEAPQKTEEKSQPKEPDIRGSTCALVNPNLRIVFATRSMNDSLFSVCHELLALEQLRQRYGLNVRHQRITGADSVGYFRDLLNLDADWVVNLDEDVFAVEPEGIIELIPYMQENGFAACGVPDGGVITIRQHNPVACNAFFNVMDVRRVRGAWHHWEQVVASKHRPEFEQTVPDFAKRTPFAFDHFEPYYGVFFALLDAGERILYLHAEEWQDGMTTLVKSISGEPLLLHGWYSRTWDTNPDTQSRYRIAVDFARWRQGLLRSDPSSWSPILADTPDRRTLVPIPTPYNRLAETNMGKWEALFQANRDPFPFGDTATYEKASRFLGHLDEIEDWGCGQQWFRRYLKPSVCYKGIDGSRSAGLDVLADLTKYVSKTEGILCRHVLEHNDAWETILRNALGSFTKRMVIVLFTPFAKTTRPMGYNPTIGVPDISFAQHDLVRHFDGIHWSLEEDLRTKTQYGVEQVFYLKKLPESGT